MMILGLAGGGIVCGSIFQLADNRCMFVYAVQQAGMGKSFHYQKTEG